MSHVLQHVFASAPLAPPQILATGVSGAHWRILSPSARAAGLGAGAGRAGEEENGPDDQATSGALPGTEHAATSSTSQTQGGPPEPVGAGSAADAMHDASAAPADATGAASGHSTVVGAGGGLLLAANMTLLLTERPGASLVVGPCCQCSGG